MKKNLLNLGALTIFGLGSLFGQKVASTHNQLSTTPVAPAQRTCGTQLPCQQWEDWMTQKVEEFKASHQMLENGRMASMPTYTIPVIMHVIHNGEAVGSGTNISQAQCNSQVTVLNADYAGTGLNVGNVPAVFSSLVANTGITFCLAQKDPSGNTLAEPGIHRVNRNTAGFTAPPYSNTAYIDGTIKPATIWNPSQYMNIWVLNLGGGLLGYATFPANSTNTCLSAPFGSTTDDGVVILYTAFGNTGNVAAPYNKGRTATHEVGHWLGLRHIWGDSNCGSDCVSDTPPAQTSNFGCPTFPHNNGTCSGNTTGEMTMNFMDYTDDACMYMFTPGQSTRIQASMANGTYRSNLTNSSNTVCNSTPVAPVSSFTVAGGTVCTGNATLFTSTSSGGPTTYSWSCNPTPGVTISSASTSTTNITFTNAGSYTVTLSVTNGVGNNSSSQTIVAQSCAGLCDTISNYGPTATASLYGSGGTGAWGWISGHNNYQDKAKVDLYSSYTAGFQVTGALLYFAKGYDGGTPTNVQVKVFDDNGTGGAPNTQLGTTYNLPISSIVTTGAGNTISFASPISVTGPFFLGIDGLAYGTGQDSVALITNADGETSPGTAWEKFSNNSWYPFSDATNSWGMNVSLAVFPIMCSPTTGEIEIANNTSEVVIYPNPASSTVAVSLNLKKEDNVTIRIYNSIGQVVATKQISNTTGGTFSLDVAGLSNGVYFVNVVSTQKTATKRLLIEK